MVLVDLVDVVYVHEGGDVEVVFLHKDENEKVLAFIRLFLWSRLFALNGICAGLIRDPNTS